MVCLYCRHPKTKVSNSRGHKARSFVWRRRYCPNCKQSFSTNETASFDQLPEVYDRKTNTKTPLDAFRLALSIVPLLETTHQPNIAYELSKTVIEHIMTTPTEQKQLTNIQVAEATHQVLSRFDHKIAMQYGIKYDVISLPKR